jgi:hypothetical protein
MLISWTTPNYSEMEVERLRKHIVAMVTLFALTVSVASYAQDQKKKEDKPEMNVYGKKPSTERQKALEDAYKGSDATPTPTPTAKPGQPAKPAQPAQPAKKKGS